MTSISAGEALLLGPVLYFGVAGNLARTKSGTLRNVSCPDRMIEQMLNHITV